MIKTVRKFVTRAVFAAILLLSCIDVNATTDPTLSALEWKGSLGSLKVDSFRLVSDINFYGSPASIERTFSIRNLVSLGIDESSPIYVQTDFTVSINLEVTKTRPDNTDSVFQKTLTVEYKKGEGQKFNALQYVTFTNGAKVKVKILSINTNGANWDITKVLEIKNELTATRDYVFNCGIYINGLSMAYENPGLAKQDEVKAAWNDPQNGQTEYDLEWAWIEESAWPQYQAGGEFDPIKIFEAGATRVTVNQTSYKIPLLYEGKGKLFARVRPAQIREGGQRVEGKWSWTAAGTTGTPVAFEFNGHEENLNWQASTIFAEEGKRKTIIQYYDGTLRGRQTVTKDNTTLTTVVAETFYDYQGRVMIQVLPVPTINTIIEYAANFNRFVNETGSPKSMYDKLNLGEGICIKPASALSNSSGTANYYSPSNAFLALPNGDSRKSEYDKFIPDGEGYPFTETRYTPDATGRIATQSGVGPAFKLGSGHETKYFYESPDQAELDALFGTDAGYASHYTKGMARDANGQYSVSYVDMHGRTVATALVGQSPDNLQQLNSYNSRSVTKNLLDNETNNVVGKSIISSKSIVVPQTGTYTFNYQLSPDKLSLLNCTNQSVCYDCLYDLIITIKSDCGDIVAIPGKSNPYVVKNFTLNQYLSDCNTNAGRSPGFAENFSVALSEGAYTITKELKLNTEAQNYYRETVFKPANTCKTLQDFINAEYQLLLSQTNCNLTCESCNTALGTFIQFRERFISQAGPFTPAELAALEPQIQVSFDEAKANCDRICNANTDDGFDGIRAIRQIMLTDVTPITGQYGWMGTSDRTKRYNIFNTADNNSYELFPQAPPDWQKPQQWNSLTNNLETGSYKDENGNTDPVNASLTGLTPEQFAAAFKSSWAEGLLPHHPEYCKLITTERFLKPTYQFEAAMNKAATWQEAATAGYIQNLLNLDPFFTNASSPGYSYRSVMLQKMQQYANGNDCNGGQVTISMWQVAQGSVFCQRKTPDCGSPDNQTACLLAQAVSPANTPLSGCITDWDYVWKNYRSIYLSQRKIFITQYLKAQCGNISNADILSFNVYTLRFPEPGVSGAPSTDITLLNTLFDQLNSGNVNGSVNAGNGVMQEQYDITCRSYATMWINRLKECPATATAMTTADEAWIVDNLVKICKAGSDATHIQGSASLPVTAPPVYDPVYGVNYREFPDVVLKFLQIKGIAISTLCHPWQIEFPKPYDKTPAITNQQVITKPKDCECQQLANLKFEYQQAGFAGTFSLYLEYHHGTYISQGALDTLTSLCNNSYTCTFLPKPVTIPPVLQCRDNNEPPVKTCIDCSEYLDIKATFTAQFGSSAPIAEPQTEADLRLNHAFEQFANYKTGFSKHWSEYVAFGNQCNNSGLIPCTRLDSLLQQFYLQYPNAGTGSNCRQLFTQFFNNSFGTFYTFEQIMNLYVESCGKEPDVCKQKIDCSGFKQIIQDFYNQYGANIFQNTNCSNLFTAFVNQRLQSAYTYLELQKLYAYLCGCSLDVCSFPNCNALTAVYNAFRQQYQQPWLLSSCDGVFTQYFNQYFAFAPGTYSFSQITVFFTQCLNDGCGPDLSQLCLPPYSCATLQQIVTNFLEIPDTTSNCQQHFAAYFNERMYTAFSFPQLVTIYQNVCGAAPAVCTPVYDCIQLQALMAAFKQEVVYNQNNCESLFTQYFNTHFGSSLSYGDITNLYVKGCGIMQMACSDPIAITSCSQLEAVRDNFKQLYPDPGVQLGNLCQQTFRNYFNSYFGTNCNDSTIRVYYQTLCGVNLNVCATQCNVYVDFVNQFNARYQGLILPSEVKKQLFVFLFNQQFPGVNSSGYSYKSVKEILQGCLSGAEPVPSNGVTYSAWDRNVLLSMKQVYYLLHPEGMPAGCELDFSSWFNLYLGTDFTYAQLQSRYNTVVGAGAGEICASAAGGQEIAIDGAGAGPNVPANLPPLLCGLNDPIFTPVEVNTDPCKDLYKFAVNRGEERYELYLDSLRNVFDAAYLAKCVSVKNLESFTVTHAVSEYHYTLYYYDQVGQLVRTVPPEGVDARHGDVIFLTNVKNARAANAATPITPTHRLTTEYRYNTLKQIIQQKDPDGGTSKFWYDRLGRLVISQNAKQAIAPDGMFKFSYTLYDEQGRIKEIGQKPQSQLMSQAISRDSVQLKSWMLSGGAKEQITRTGFDVSYFNGDDLLASGALLQRNLRTRVSYLQYFETTPTNGNFIGTHQNAVYYSYDVEGNVDTLLQDYNEGVMKNTGNRFKKIVYDYDNLSGNLKAVAYQRGQPDQFYYKYEYDLENRLKSTLTSHDDWIWEKDARYNYYKHGALARTIIGQSQVQGIDYAYNLQGWLKGVNSTVVNDGNFDMGGDGFSSGLNRVVARDAYGFGLNYFANDYNNISSATSPFVTISGTLPALPDAVQTGKQSYTGSITTMVINIPKIGDAKTYSYKYDQLNRLVAMNVYNGFNNATNSFVAAGIEDYKERISYDQNGNIKTYLRNGTTVNANQLAMDNMTYVYNLDGNGKLLNNRLRHVKDLVDDANYTEDIDDQSDDNYEYDALGNLIRDSKSGISSITWNMYGKIVSITKNGSITQYTYDVFGNRISKVSNGRTTSYVRDFSDNVVSIYESGNGQINSGHLTQTEVPLYGSGRIGVFTLNRDVELIPTNTSSVYSFERGNKFYELVSHLENVLITITDRKIGVDSDGDGMIDFYNAEVVSASDYYAFGMLMPERNLSSDKYRYGFNGQERSKELGSNFFEATYWEYDSRIGRRWNGDPIEKIGESPYASLGNNPINLYDPNGADAIKRAKKWAEKRGITNYNLRNNTDGNLVLSYSLEPNGDSKTNGEVGLKVFKRSAAGRFLNKTKQFAEGFAEGTVELAKFAINVFNPDPDKNSLVQTVKFTYKLVTDPVGTVKNVIKAVKSIDWKDPATYGKGLSMILVPAASVKAVNYLSRTVIAGRTAAITVETMEASVTTEAVTSTAVETTVSATTEVAPKVVQASETILNTPIKLTTSSTSTAPSFTYTVYQKNGSLFKFGVSDANGVRLQQSLKLAGEGAYHAQSSIIPKFQAHIFEKYLRSLQYNSTGVYKLPGMKVPYPVDFGTNLPIRKGF